MTAFLRFRHAVACLALPAAAAMAAPPVIENPAEPPVRETVELRESWRAGGENESDVLLGQVGVAISGPAGEVYALDTQLSQVLVFDSAGKHLRTLGRQGDGPGEFRQPVGLFLPGDGSVAVQQAFPGRITYLDAATGTPRGTWELGKSDPTAGGLGFVETARSRNGTFVISAATAAFDQAGGEIHNLNYLAMLGADGGEIKRLAQVETTRSLTQFTIDELASFFPGDRGLWDVGPDGRVCLATRYDAYSIAVYGPDGALVREITRAHDARVRTEEEKEEQRTGMQVNINGQVPRIDWKLEDRAPCIDRLQILDDGSLWVRNSHGADAWESAGRQVFDVYGPDGRLAREVTVAVPAGGKGNRLILLDDGRFLLIKGMDRLSISISAGNDEELAPLDQELGDTLLELICYES
ncbi:MAG TPA: 6-bladed beta-propeller [Candidatus Krumholzibacteria bacterium]|nr:6-bladed beta-propeller [Candidatus Krumholzibacteria bacterium]HPD72343.1 6-bladed beta-propeller [Candidatus Krumholzibacteria bacterium]HRY40725.1 6-bladed beta-propeller [Candidatus Krumholzibacteria bacterium]